MPTQYFAASSSTVETAESTSRDIDNVDDVFVTCLSAQSATHMSAQSVTHLYPQSATYNSSDVLRSARNLC